MTNDLQAELAALKAENRTLRVGGGATFEELEASGKAGGGRVNSTNCCLSRHRAMNRRRRRLCSFMCPRLAERP
jgi:hypothetical protein